MVDFEFPFPRYFAHRGASAHAPENTMVAFRTALEQGAQAIELDVKCSADGEVIVLHDQTLDRTTNGSGDLRTFTLQHLKSLDAGAKFDEKFAGEKIPTLREVLDQFGQRLIINIELTNYATPGDDLVTRVASLVKQFQLESRVLFSSFNPMNLRKARALCPQVPCGLLALDGMAGWLARSRFAFYAPHEALHPYLLDVSEAMVKREHAAGRKVNVWTVNQPEDMERLFSWDVDAIFTDDPITANKVLGSLNK